MAALIVSSCAILLSQSARSPTFEVASVKPSPPHKVPSMANVREQIDSSRVQIESYSLSLLIQMAFRLPEDQIVAPGWMAEQRFDIQAKLPPGSSVGEVPEMLQTLLAERFKLAVHHDQKVRQVYAMTVAKGGPKFHESTGESSAKNSDPGACNGGFHKVCREVTMEVLARPLTMNSRYPNMPGALDRPVIDMTGLKGTYDFSLDQGVVGGGRVRSGDAPPAPSATEPEVVTVFDALKVLGLKLEPTRHTYDILVIDHVERVPTEN